MNASEKSLDPENWEELESLGHRMITDLFNQLRHVRNQPVWQSIPAKQKEKWKDSLPDLPGNLCAVYEQLQESLIPYPTGNGHPRFFAWADGAGNPVAMLAALLAAGMNPNVCAGEQSALYLEQQVISWMKEYLCFPAGASGVLVSSGSMANLTALLVARNNYSKVIRQNGLSTLDGQLVLYTSVETHSCIDKAADIMGLGRNAVRRIEVNDKFQIDLRKLESRIKKDRAEGFIPFCIVATVGTVNTGAVDPLRELASLCQQEQLWLHIDGAYGAWAAAEDGPVKQEDISLADSLSFDMHKWIHIPFAVGCTLIKNRLLHRETFEVQADYLVRHERGLFSGPDMIADYGIDMSRGFKSLEIWMTIKTYGISQLRQLIRQNMEQAIYAAALIINEPALELMAPVTLNVVCFRFIADPDKTNAINREILMRLQEDGTASLSYAMLNGSYCLRAMVMNHRTQRTDLDILIKEVLKIGSALVAV
ncbi:aminotransferase class V-fold PLP-dependent enzyme [Terrimonas sp. NA20]|uniref:Aminotransferase class V-fold PLP-dependent enzyme n=1 Tax=Terrimonas ginsenosidimutans TaxID=2908004 RepID=A0ABS9KK47_9BACT|nr:aminotransferase class V-fold PLP-dependent enzyme [Terrimonas ginsenosidimutans]MCG2612698.1 aminotransferase class V-fold PLP-dependent enzyme [Terrimonas ginsenosidimutans]